MFFKYKSQNNDVIYDTYRGFEYAYSKNAYEVYDKGILTNTRIVIASGSGFKNPKECAIKSIDEYYNSIYKI